MVDLFKGYNALVQPVPNRTAIPLIVKIAMQLVLLIDVVRFSLFSPNTFRTRSSRSCKATSGSLW